MIANEPQPLDGRRWPSVRRVALGVALLAGAMALTALGGFDLEGARVSLLGSESSAWFALLPFALLLVIDATAWALALGVPADFLMLGRLVQARLGIEAVSLTVPGSILVADGVAPMVFSRSASVPVPVAIAAVGIKKWGIIVGHVAMLWLAALVGGSFFDRLDAQESFWFAPQLTLITAGFVTLGMCLWIGSLLSNGAAERLRSTVGRIQLAWTQRLMERAIAGAARTDAHAHLFFGGPRRRIGALMTVSALVWLAESFEVYVLFRILGASPSFAQVLAMEALLTVVRTLAFFSPGGLGAQEFAYLTLIPPLLGVPGAELASGFVVLRRLRDVATIALGYLSLATRVVRV